MINAQLPEPSVEEGGSAYFYCNGPADTRWFRKQQDNTDREIITSERFELFNIISEGVTYANMTINNVVKNDSGIYVCKDTDGNSFDVNLMVYEGMA